MKYLIPIFIAVFLIFPIIVSAQILIPLPSRCNSIGSDYPNTYRVCTFIMMIARFLMILGFAIGVIVIIVGGIMYMTAGADETKVTNAKKAITYGVIGFAIVMGAAFIINLIDEVIIRSFTGIPL